MNAMLGQGLVLVALLCATVGAVAGFVGGWRRSPEAARLAWQGAVGFAVASIAANLVMIGALLMDDFSVGYVAEVGSRATPWYIKIPSLWASLSGSILFWAGVLGVYVGVFAAAHRGKHPEYLPWALSSLLATSVFFSFLIGSVANPFEPMSPAPPDGPGPNPLLQNHWLMAIHPPTLYLGYVGMSVPFSMALAALAAGRLESGWLVPLRRWLLVPWLSLTVGIVLGGWWSYEVLGWGGYWAWDPVENASFHPWLTATAALHSALVTQRRGAFKTWTLVLVIASFLLTLFGTFLTRSGVFSSVHAFTTSDIGKVFLVAIAVVFTGSLVLLALRDHVLNREWTLAERLPVYSPLSREMAILLQNGVFSVFTAFVMLGTVFPLVVEAWEGRQLSVGGPWFDRLALPLGTLIVFLMGVGPSLPWGGGAAGAVGVRFIGPTALGALTALAGFGAGFTSSSTLLALFVCGFALFANIGELVEPARQRAAKAGEPLVVAAFTVVRRARRRYGGLLSHVGVVIAVMAIALSKGGTVERDFTLRPGESAEIGGFDLTFTGARLDQQPHRDSLVAAFAVTRGGQDLGTWEPRLNHYRTQREPIATPTVRSTPARDLYLSLTAVEPDGAWASVRVIVMPAVWWLWASMPVFLVSAVMILWPDRRGAEVTS